MMTYEPLSRNPDIYNWTQPFIGLKYHFYKKYEPPFKSHFRNSENTNTNTNTNTDSTEKLSIYWTDSKVRTWNFGVSSSGQTITQHIPANNQTTPLLKYREFTIVPRFNYWINQAVMVGVQGSFYHYENNADTIPTSNGFGTGLQARFYPLSFKNPTEFRAIPIDKMGDWIIAPIIGVEIRMANFSWAEPENTGQKWQYFDFQPYAGFVLAYKRWLNVFCSVGPTLGTEGFKNTTPINGIGIIGLEYHFTK